VSELKNVSGAVRSIRCNLLATVSMLSLVGFATTASHSEAADADQDQPTVWIELGGQLERQIGQGDPYAPSFVLNNPNIPAFEIASPLKAQDASLFSIGANGAITFQPAGSDWSFLASVKYGRSISNKRVFHRSPERQFHTVAHFYSHGFHLVSGTITPSDVNFVDTDATSHQSHTILDFEVGKDVGLGLFGRSGTSTLAFGVRFAQFSSRSSATIHAFPIQKTVNQFTPNSYYARQYPSIHFYLPRFVGHNYDAQIYQTRSFHGIGPSIAWKASTRVLELSENDAINVDWGVNGAVLFGRQRARGTHTTTTHISTYSSYKKPGNFGRSRSVVVPNVGGFAGLSFRYANAKVNFGYRGDFFFGAMDTGNDIRKTKTVGFYGPFASVSVGIGGYGNR
jgi:iron complex outermembrane receptor protein